MSETATGHRARGKEAAARAALDRVADGMTLGLGSGSTAELFVRALGAKIAETGWRVRGVPTSEGTRACAQAAGVALIDMDEAGRLDLTVDGADEVDPAFNLIKGGGGCLLREKIVAEASAEFVVVVDETKLVSALGAFPLPVEIERFGQDATRRRVEEALRGEGCAASKISLRMADDRPFISDGGNFIIDCATGEIGDPHAIAAVLDRLTGVVEHGLFLDLTRTVIVGGPDGVRTLTR